MMNEENRKLGLLLKELKSQEEILRDEVLAGKDLLFRNITQSEASLYELRLLIAEIENGFLLK